MKEMRLAADRTGKALSQKPPTQIDNAQSYFLFTSVLRVFFRDMLIGPVSISVHFTLSG